MITIKELYEKWNNISPLTGGFLLVSGEHPLSFHIGYVNGEDKCFIVLNSGMVNQVPSSQAISVECIQTSKNEYSLKFVLNYPSLEELFIKLCWDLIEASQVSSHPIEKIISQYKSWMKLLKQASTQLLSSSQQKGLIGELLYLDEKINEIGEFSTIKSWVGPEGSDQDFLFENSWSEIKSTSIASDSLSISSVQQLDRSDKGYLVVYFMDKTSSNSNKTICLPEIIAKIQTVLSPQSQDEFLCKLAKYGYFHKDVEHYRKSRYRFSEKRIYIVEGTFPRLTKNNIPAEISNAKYELSLSAINSFRV